MKCQQIKVQLQYAAACVGLQSVLQENAEAADPALLSIAADCAGPSQPCPVYAHTPLRLPEHQQHSDP